MRGSDLTGPLRTFWQQQPALFYGLTLLIGCSFALSPDSILSVPLALLYGPLLLKIERKGVYRLGLGLLLLAAAYLFTSSRHQLPSLPAHGIKGEALVTLASLRQTPTHFGQRWQLRGDLHRFKPAQAHDPAVKNAHVRITLPHDERGNSPQTTGTYLIQGRLTGAGAEYRLIPHKNKEWLPLTESWNLAGWRFSMKQRLASILYREVRQPEAAAFLTGLATGEFSNREVSSALGRFGLQHIMAISGFHFSILASLMSLALGALLPRRLALLVLIVLLCIYLVFLGSGASIIRAWISSLVVIGGQLIEKRSRGLNTLGIALIVLLTMDPTISQSIAFQLSFLATGAILLFYPPMERTLQWLFPKRPLSQVTTMHGGDQHGVALLAFFRGALALGLAINLVMLPVSLYLFQKFPWFSLAYNLFFPFLTSISMLLLLIAFPLQLILPPAASLIFSINSTYTQWILNLTLQMPTTLDYILRIEGISKSVLICYLSFLGLAGIYISRLVKKQNQDREILAFL